MIRFRFALTPLANVVPWGRDRATQHWFGLSDGAYWVETEEHELLRYAEPTLRARPDSRRPPYVDYYVVRLWEDLLAMLPEVLEPVPGDLLPFVSGALPELDGDEVDDDVLTALDWHGGHVLNLGYLRNAPTLRWWRDTTGGTDVVRTDWRHDPDPDIAFAGPPALRFSVPTEAFVEAVTRFDREFLAAMEERVAALEAAGGLPGVEVDLAALRAEQRQRAGLLPQVRGRRLATDWERVRAGVRSLGQARA
ncbi:DUF5984 family protein [Streptomyces sp. NPDC051940]|uniref:DUF5984 family protein n=1 Tax=Streptomyces sp. NPDC051940 TaxID=3155675 RepID=UPI00341B97FE